MTAMYILSPVKSCSCEQLKKTTIPTYQIRFPGSAAQEVFTACELIFYTDSRCLMANESAVFHKSHSAPLVPSYRHTHHGVFTNLAKPLIAWLEIQMVDVSGLI